LPGGKKAEVRKPLQRMVSAQIVTKIHSNPSIPKSLVQTSLETKLATVRGENVIHFTHSHKGGAHWEEYMQALLLPSCTSLSSFHPLHVPSLPHSAFWSSHSFFHCLFFTTADLVSNRQVNLDGQLDCLSAKRLSFFTDFQLPVIFEA